MGNHCMHRIFSVNFPNKFHYFQSYFSAFSLGTEHNFLFFMEAVVLRILVQFLQKVQGFTQRARKNQQFFNAKLGSFSVIFPKFLVISWDLVQNHKIIWDPICIFLKSGLLSAQRQKKFWPKQGQKRPLFLLFLGDFRGPKTAVLVIFLQSSTMKLFLNRFVKIDKNPNFSGFSKNRKYFQNCQISSAFRKQFSTPEGVRF